MKCALIILAGISPCAATAFYWTNVVASHYIAGVSLDLTMTADDASIPMAEPEIATFEVAASRLASGTYDHQKDREVGEGDINASYSADKIATEGRVRKPFRFGADRWVTVGLCGRGGQLQAEAFRLVSREIFKGTVTSYHERTDAAEAAEAARNDPMGFYHGMMVHCGKELCVLSGPPARFIANPELSEDRLQETPSQQLRLF